MNLLFDFITVQHKHGAAEYVRRVFYEVLSVIETRRQDITLFALYDSTKGIAYDDLKESALSSRGIVYVDICDGLSVIIQKYNIDCFFLGCAQYSGPYPEISSVRIRSIIVMHDCVYEEWFSNKLNEYVTLTTDPLFQFQERKSLGWRVYWDLKGATMRFCRWLLYSRQNGIYEHDLGLSLPAIQLVRNNPKASIITVSEFSKHSIHYNFDIPDSKVKVLYSPERIFNSKQDVENELLHDVIAKGIRYYLLLNANRKSKNADKVVRAFQKFALESPSSYLVTVGYGNTSFSQHIDLPFLSEGDLVHAYQHCYAFIFPSFFEGFGYPPLEAMRYGKPVLSSNTCSMPEILGDAPLYFSPFYESDIFRCLSILSESEYAKYSQRAETRYSFIAKRQEQDLQNLCLLILSDDCAV